MKHYTIAWQVNNLEAFKLDVLSPAIESMNDEKEGADYSCYAVSKGDEFGKLEKIEDTLNDRNLSPHDKLDVIEQILNEL